MCINDNYFYFQFVRNLGTTIRHAAVIGLWASPPPGRRALTKPSSPAVRHTGFSKLGGLINNAVHSTKKSPSMYIFLKFIYWGSNA